MFINADLRCTNHKENKQIVGFDVMPSICGDDVKNAKIATEAIVFMYSAINDDIKLPIAYYLTSSTTADKRYLLAQSVMESIIDCGVRLTSITFDGHISNPGACTSLGANMDIYSNEYDPSFYIKGSRIHVLLDPSHMMKMARGAIGNTKTLYDGDNNPIKWEYFVNLVNFKEKRNFHAMHKMTQAHIDFHKKPMKVVLALQTLHPQTAAAIEYLMDQKYPQFAGAEATIKYIRMWANIFKVFNSTTLKQRRVCV